MNKDAVAPVPIRRRNCTSKTRTGCHTCKIRRLKCDEKKPACERCTGTGRRCDGYLTTSPSSRVGSPFETILRMSNNLPGTKREKRSFQYFVANTVSELAGYFTSSFWEQLILQASTAEPSLRHAIIAIGSLHEDFSSRDREDSKDERRGSTTPLGLSSRPMPGLSPSDQRARKNPTQTQTQKRMEFAVKQYSKAISHLRLSLSAGTQTPVTALMSCLLFVCFDSLRGNLEAAMVHLQSGLKILRDVQARQQSQNRGGGRQGRVVGANTEEAYMIKRDIKPIFARLSNQAILYIDTRETQDRAMFGRELVIDCEAEEEENMAFETLEVAREKLDWILSEQMRMIWLCDGSVPMSAQDPTIHAMYDRSYELMNAWSQSFVTFMSAHSANLSPFQIRGAALLKIIHLTGLVMLKATPSPTCTSPISIVRIINTQSTFAPFTEQFRTILNLSRSLVAAMDQDAQNQPSSSSKGTFSADLGLVGPLYYLCVKCLDKDIREEGLRLIGRWRRKEGMWDSQMVNKLVLEFWEIEKWYDAAKEDRVEMIRALGRERDVQEVCELVDVGDGRWEWRLNLEGGGRKGDGHQSARTGGLPLLRRQEEMMKGGNSGFSGSRNPGGWGAYAHPL